MTDEASIRIAVEAAGAEDAQKNIEDTEGTLEDAGEGMEDTADSMQELNRRMAGLGATLATSMALAAAGVLASIPVVGEAFAGLQSVWQATMFQLDSLMRSLGVGGLSGVLFDISEVIYNLEGAVGALAGILGGLVTVLGAGLAAAMAYLGPLTALASVKGALIVAGKALVGVLAAVAGAISLPVVAVAALVAGLAILAFMFREEIANAAMTAIDGIRRFGSWVANGLPQLIVEGVTDAASALSDFVSDALSYGTDLVVAFANGITDKMYRISGAVSNLAGLVKDTLTGLASDAVDWGVDLMQSLIDGILSMVDELTDTVSDVAGIISDHMPSSPAETGPLSDLDQAGPGFISEVATGIEANVSQVSHAADSAASGMASGDGGFRADRGNQTPVVKMDGRRLTRQDGRYRRDGTASRGRNG